MTMTRRETKAASLAGWLSRRGLPAVGRWCVPILVLGLLSSPLLASSGHGFRQTAHPAPAPQSHPAPAPQSHPMPQASAPQARPNQQARPGGQHLPEWWNNHRNLTPDQQADALRREPGFRNLPPDQQQRLINRLHSLDGKTPQQQQRILDRNENFERLSPERRQEVRGAAQAMKQMPP